jgi:uncharacterized Zn finger protein
MIRQQAADALKDDIKMTWASSAVQPASINIDASAASSDLIVSNERSCSFVTKCCSPSD